MYGPPKDVDGECNARLFIGDDYGDNTSTMRCNLPPNHEPPHCEKYHSCDSGDVVVTWQRDVRKECAHCHKLIKSVCYVNENVDGKEVEKPLCVDCYGAHQGLIALEKVVSREIIEAIEKRIAEGYEGIKDLLVMYHEASYCFREEECAAIIKDLKDLIDGK